MYKKVKLINIFILKKGYGGMQMEDEKMIRVKKSTWDGLSRLKSWPGRTNFNDVIEHLLRIEGGENRK